jgi:hypothetical protein
MRKANGVLSVVAALVLSFQAGTTIVCADDGRQTSAASTESNMPLAALGGVFVSLGVWLLRRPRDMSPDR